MNDMTYIDTSMNDLYENNVEFMYKNGHFLLKFYYFVYNFDVFKCIYV